MKKKITAIELNNYKGYFGKYEPMLLQNGENLLIYGENGSGKSSLYKALNNFFLSSRDVFIVFTKNKYNDNEPGEINIEFSDYDNSTEKIVEGTNNSYKFSDTTSDHNVQFIQNAALVKGFLDYTDLLKIYLHDDPHPNLFNLIVLTILGEHIPISSGGNFKFNRKWEQLQKDLTTNSYTRNDWTHRNAIAFLSIYETHLRATLGEVFDKMNYFLTNYFEDFDIELDYILQPLIFNYGWKWEWHTTSDLRLIVKKSNQVYANGYSEYLNEARLSAISVCMYLASLNVTNTNIDVKILYLDDVFIGLDSGNRIPILNILRDEFSDYQKFISTYDRHWFELAKRHSQLNNENRWKVVELYVGNCVDSSGNQIDKPIIINGETHYEKAVRYLYHNSSPDYPAAANYFRKALEEVIHNYMINFELIDGDGIQIPEYKLSSLAYRTKRFLERAGHDLYGINTIISLLHILLHPLSHHEIISPIYKSELLLIDKAFSILQKQLKNLNPKRYQCKLEKDSKVKVKFFISSAPRHSYEYEITLKDSIVLHKTEIGIIKLPSQCFLTKMSGIKDDCTLPSFTPRKDDIRFNYNSLTEAVDKLYLFLVNDGVTFPKPADYLDCLEYFDTAGWVSIKSLVVWRE